MDTGVGLGMAMAKQQQFHADQLQLEEIALAKAKKNKIASGAAQLGNFGSIITNSSQSESESSHRLQAAGAMVIHQPNQVAVRKLL